MQYLNGNKQLTFQWKMIFNPDLTKQVQEVTFNRKIKKMLLATVLFNNIPGLTLDIKLSSNHHIKDITQKISKIVGLLSRFQTILQRLFLLTVCKTFIRIQLEYADVIYNQT